LTFIGLGAIDDFELNKAANDTEEQQYILNNIPVNTQWNYANGLVYKRFHANGFTTYILSRNMLNNESIKYLNNTDRPEDLVLDYQSREIENKARIEHIFQRGPFRILLGGGLQRVKYTNETFNKIYDQSGPAEINYNTAIDFTKYSLFTSLSRSWLDDRLSVSLSIRGDGNNYASNMSNPLRHFSPRRSVSDALNEFLVFNASGGRYIQLPPYTVLGYKEGSILLNKRNRVTYIRSNQFSAGFEINSSFSSRISVEGYFKKYNNYPFLVRKGISLSNLGGDFGVIGNEEVTSTSSGRSYGLELMYQQRLYKGFYGILAYTLGRSEFRNGDNTYVPSSWDARHIGSLTFGKQLRRDWEIGIKWRFQSGLPLTPYDDFSSSLVLNWERNAQGIRDYGQLNTLRSEASNTIDVRIDKKWYFSKWSIEAYFDVQNVTGQSVDNNVLILDRPLDADEMPIGEGIIINPDDPISMQRYKLKYLNDAIGQPLPTIGFVLGF
jgi:hypothetical protein